MKEKDVRPKVKLDAATIGKIIEDITYLQLDESDRSYGYTSAKLREYLRVDDINTFSRGNELNVTLYFTIFNNPQPHELSLMLERVR